MSLFLPNIAFPPLIPRHDPLISSVILLSRMENSTSSADTAIINIAGTVSAGGFASFGTGHSKWGTRNYITSSSADRYDPAAASWAPGNGDFEVALWVWPTTLASSSFRGLWAWGHNGNDSGMCLVWSFTPDGKIHVYTGAGAAVPSADVIVSAAGVVTTGAYHFAQLKRDNGVLEIGWDGVSRGTYTDPNNYDRPEMWGLGQQLGASNFEGYSSEVRYTRGAAGSFAGRRPIYLPTAPLPAF